MRLIFATQNQSKVNEVKKLLSDIGFEVFSATEIGITEDVIEDGKTFKENSLKKARFIYDKTKEWTVAEDAGICIKGLNGKPGIYSARWAGENATDKDIVNYTLKKMKDLTAGNRQAWFECCVTLMAPNGKQWNFVGKKNGTITLEPRGKERKKFPYDYIFVPAGYKKTYGEMSDEQKNSLSHRGIAFLKLKNFLETKQYLQ